MKKNKTTIEVSIFGAVLVAAAVAVLAVATDRLMASFRTDSDIYGRGVWSIDEKEYGSR